jgi:hypothetical protein
VARFVWDKGWQSTLKTEGKPRVQAAARQGKEAMQQTIPVSDDGSNGRPAGYARASMEVVEGGTGPGYYFDAGATARTPDGYPYPAVLEYGSPPHDITSHGDYPLRDKHGNVYGRTVHHPGTPEYAWCRRAIAEIEGREL